jgi:hypothetical protein
MLADHYREKSIGGEIIEFEDVAGDSGDNAGPGQRLSSRGRQAGVGGGNGGHQTLSMLMACTKSGGASRRHP